MNPNFNVPSNDRYLSSGVSGGHQEFEAQYREISVRLGQRFRAEVDSAIEHIKTSPSSAGHFVNTGSQIVKEVRRRNLRSCPFLLIFL